MGLPEAPTYLSGLVIRTMPDRFDDVLAALRTFSGVSVHHTDTATVRIVVVQEAPTLGAEMDGMRRIQTLPGVIDASLVYHYLGDAGAPSEPLAASPFSESQRETER